MTYLTDIPYIAVGGIGGSGTRLIAQMLEVLGFTIGRDLNESRDNLTFTFLFKDPDVLAASNEEFLLRLQIFQKSLEGISLNDREVKFVLDIASKQNRHHSREWLQARASFLISGSGEKPSQSRAWKEPNTHIFLPKFLGCIPDLKYIHVMRNGLYMVHSKNQNQPRLWGPYLLETSSTADGGDDSLKWWCYVHDRIRSLRDCWPRQILLLKFEDVVALRLEAYQSLLSFIGFEATGSRIACLRSLVESALVKPEPLGTLPIVPSDDQRRCLSSFGYRLE